MSSNPNSNFIPYGQFFVCQKDLFVSSCEDRLFTFLFNEYLRGFRAGNVQPYKGSLNHLANTLHLSRNVVRGFLKKLDEIGAGSLSQNRMTVEFSLDANYILGVLKLIWENRADKEVTADIISAFWAGDRRSLRNHGLSSANNIDFDLAGNPNIECSSTWSKRTSCDNLEQKDNLNSQSPTDKQDTNSTWNKRTSCSEIKSELVLLDQVGDLIDWSEIDKLLKIQDLLNINLEQKDNLPPQLDLKGQVKNDNLEQKDKLEMLKNINWQFLSFAAQVVIEALGEKGVQLVLLDQPTCPFRSSNLSFCSNYNKYIIKKEESNERSEAQGIERSEIQYIGGEENFEAVEESEEEISERSKRRRQRKEANLPKEVQLRRKRENLQKFSEEEVDEIIEDLNNCLDSPTKIFINRFWNYMAVDFSQPENEEDDDEGLPAVDITGEAIPASFIKRYMESAYEDTLSLLKDKRFSPDDEELPVVDTEFTPEEVQLIMGWEQYSSKGSSFFTVTKTNFFNPRQSLGEEQKINSRSRRSRTPEDNADREDDFQYVQKINILGETDEGFDQLTPIEAFIYYFCQDCLIQDENHRIIDRQRAQLCVKGEDDVRRGLLEQGLKLEDFSDICCTSIPRDLKETDLRPRMFSADKIRRANKKHGFTSIIDQTSLEELLEKSS